jgi:hypothetical protein
LGIQADDPRIDSRSALCISRFSTASQAAPSVPSSSTTTRRTTDTHLAHEFGMALHDGFGGAVNFSYESDHEMLRVHWAR